MKEIELLFADCATNITKTKNVGSVDGVFGEQERIAREEAQLQGNPDFMSNSRSPQTEHDDIVRGR